MLHYTLRRLLYLIPTLLGITFMLHQVGAFLGSWLGGVALEATGSYDSMWLADLGLAVAAAAVALTIRERSVQQAATGAGNGRPALATAA